MGIINSMVIPLILGLTFFLFGMNVMSGGLETMAGGGLERTMKKVTANDFLGFFLLTAFLASLQIVSAKLLVSLLLLVFVLLSY